MTVVTGRAAGVSRPGVDKRAGYGIAIAVNVALLFLANNLLDWDLVPFLTDDFARVLWLVNISLLGAVIVNVMYLRYDRAWFKSVCQIGLGWVSMAVAIRMYQVFPFDFTAYEFNWEPLARFVIVMTTVGVGIGILVEVIALSRDVVRHLTTTPTSNSDDDVTTTAVERRQQ
jgi:hypothetical protein